MDIHGCRAAILDMDGVVTRTAALHARAWKRLFDELLERRQLAPFDIEDDYRRYVDGKPRYDGARDFLESRGIELPEGAPDDASDEETICGLGNRKNEYVLGLLEEEGVEAYDDTVEQIANWKRREWSVAVISSSRNCAAVLNSGGLLRFFDAKVDGNDAERLGLEGKPAPDVFLQAAAELEVDPSEALIVEDAIAGVQAGREGGFAVVVGVARNGGAGRLREAGADIVVRDLRELEAAFHCPPGEQCLETPSAAIEHGAWISTRLRGHELALFLDYDGTLTPIVRRPEEATLGAGMRTVLRELAGVSTVAVVSGRDRQDVERMVALEELVYAGSHGFDILGPGIAMQHGEAAKALPELDEAERALRRRIDSIEGARVERKRFALAVHYREVERAADVERVEEAIDEARSECRSLRKMSGKKIFELQPDVDWNKGEAVLWLRDALGLAHPDVLSIYIGDDVTDEDAFRALRQRSGIGILVGEPAARTSALYYLRDPGEVEEFLRALLATLKEKRSTSPGG